MEPGDFGITVYMYLCIMLKAGQKVIKNRVFYFSEVKRVYNRKRGRSQGQLQLISVLVQNSFLFKKVG